MRKTPATKNLLLLGGFGAAMWLGSISPAANKTYELSPDIPTSYQNPSNTVMVLDAYERLMDNYMSLVQSNLNAMSGDVGESAKILAGIDRKIENINIRMSRIERALNLQTVPGTTADGDPY